jgi:F420-non-reducing hydrogenase iron-sulfur subunit
MNNAREIKTEAVPVDLEVQMPPVTMFLCANSGRPGRASTSAARPKPKLPEFSWPFQVEQVVVPCAGRIQPEHLLKTFEAGADLVLVVACEDENCHYIEGCKRCKLRVEFVQSILKEIGLGEERLRLEILPGSAAEDLMADSGNALPEMSPDSLAERISAVRERTIQAFNLLPPNPLRQADAGNAEVNGTREGSDITDDNRNT